MQGIEPPEAGLRWEMHGGRPHRIESPDGTPLLCALVAALPTDPCALLGALVQLLEQPVRRAAATALAAAWTSSPRAMPH